MFVSGTATIRSVDAVFRNPAVVLAVGGAIFLSCLSYAMLTKPQYVSTMRLLVQTRSNGFPTTSDAQGVANGTQPLETQVNSESVLLQSTDLLEALVRYRDETLLKQRAPEDGSIEMAAQVSAIQRQLEVSPIGRTNLIQVSFRDDDASAAKLSLNWLSVAFVERERRAAATADADTGRGEMVHVRIAQEPTLSWRPVRPERTATVLLGALVACLVSLCCIRLKEAVRETAFTPGELEAMLALPVLATVPECRLQKRGPGVATTVPNVMQLRRMSGGPERERTMDELDCSGGGHYAQS